MIVPTPSTAIRRAIRIDLYFCLQSLNFWAVDGTEMTCLILSTEVQCRQLEAWKTLPVPVGERHRQGLGSVSDHRTHHTPLWTTRKQHGQRGPKMKWSGAETAKNGRKCSKKVPGAGSHSYGPPSPVWFFLPIFRSVFRTFPSKLNISKIHFSQLFWLKNGQ